MDGGPAIFVLIIMIVIIFYIFKRVVFVLRKANKALYLGFKGFK